MILNLNIRTDYNFRRALKKSTLFDDYFMLLEYGDWSWLPVEELCTYLQNEYRVALLFEKGDEVNYNVSHRMITFTSRFGPQVSTDIRKEVLTQFRLAYARFEKELAGLSPALVHQNLGSCIVDLSMLAGH